MSGHTPGPWEVHWEANATGYPVYSIHGMSGDQKRDIPTLDANARLIAAAPELLEALKAIHGLPDNSHRVHLICATTIAKATGVNP